MRVTHVLKVPARAGDTIILVEINKKTTEMSQKGVQI
jgi:hypothetical protein